MCMVFLDLKKAFDTVPHRQLLMKLNCYDICDKANELIKSYLTCRQQFVKCCDYLSEQRHISIGVPQGSVLGPLLFLLYINDLLNSTSLGTRLFADDTVLYNSYSNIPEIEKQMTIELYKVNNLIG